MKKVFALKTPLVAAAIFLLGFLSGADESFRVTQAYIARIDPESLEAVSVSMGYNDGLALLFPEDATFIKAIEIEVKSPENVIQFPSSMAYAIYGGISQLPEEGIIDFTGERIAMEILPARLTFALQIPLKEGHGLKSDPYTAVLAETPKAESFPLFFRLFPIMKGLPDDFETAVFSVKVKPVLANEGGFLLNIAFPQGGAAERPPLSVRVDEKPILEPEKMQILAAGEHHLAVSAERYRTEVRTFVVERAKVSKVTVQMKDAAPTVSFASPDNVEVSLDGKAVANPRAALKIEAGRHTVTFSVGGYTIQRHFTAEEGKDYSVSMTMDAEVVELR